MRKLLLVAIMTGVCGAACAEDLTGVRLAQAQDTPAAQPAPAPSQAPAAQGGAAPQASPTAAAPDAAQPTTKASKPAKKRVAKRRWETDEAKARSIAAKYGVSW